MDMVTELERTGAKSEPDRINGPISGCDQAEGYVAMVCFKHGPPTLHGVELEWTIHDSDDPGLPVDPTRLAAALGQHAPRTLVADSPHQPLAAGSLLTVEPGGQVEISAPPSPSVASLVATARSDLVQLDGMLGAWGLVRGQYGLDRHRRPRRILHTPRYAALHAAFDPIGPAGLQMMCSSASVQVCLDAGEPADVTRRWHAAHGLGPPLVALFANSTYRAGRHTGWASARTQTTLGVCPPVTAPPPSTLDPATSWARLAMAAPVLCVRGPGPSWLAPQGLTFAQWVARPESVGRPATWDDLDYHLSTLFPPVRPKGYLEIRYLDAQPADGWTMPLALVAALMVRPSTIDQVLDLTASTAGRWLDAARLGLSDDQIRRVASQLVQLGCESLDHLDLDAATSQDITDSLGRKVSSYASRRCLA